MWSGAGKLWIDLTSAFWKIAIRCLILGVGFQGQAIQWRHNRDRGSKVRCHGNQFWDYIIYKWTLTGDNNIKLYLQSASTSTRWHFAFGLLSQQWKSAPIANPPNSAQLGGNPYHSPKLHLGHCSSVGMRWATDRQTHRRLWLLYIPHCLRLMRNVRCIKHRILRSVIPATTEAHIQLPISESL